MSKKINIGFLLLAASSILISCEDDENLGKQPRYRPSRLEEVAYKRELFYNDHGQVIRILSQSATVDNDVISTLQEVGYDESGNILAVKIDGETDFVYTRENGRIITTEHVQNNVASQRYAFAYQANGAIKEMLTYRYEHAAVTLEGKTSYTFDARGNVSSVKNFTHRVDFGYELASIYEYDHYDDQESVNSKFDFHTAHPGLQLFKNNPGRMISRNKHGEISAIEDYVYEYGPQGLPAKCETTITFLHTGVTGSYSTNYFFEVL